MNFLNFEKENLNQHIYRMMPQDYLKAGIPLSALAVSLAATEAVAADQSRSF